MRTKCSPAAESWFTTVTRATSSEAPAPAPTDLPAQEPAAVAADPGPLPERSPDTDAVPGSVVGGSGYLDLTMGGAAVVTQQDETIIGPGVVLTQWERLESGGWQRGAVLDVDLPNENVSMDYVYTGEVADTSTLTELTSASE